MRHPTNRAERRSVAAHKSRPRHAAGNPARQRDRLRALDAREALELIYGEGE